MLRAAAPPVEDLRGCGAAKLGYFSPREGDPAEPGRKFYHPGKRPLAPEAVPGTASRLSGDSLIRRVPRLSLMGDPGFVLTGVPFTVS
jgi:hypothetical protein